MYESVLYASTMNSVCHCHSQEFQIPVLSSPVSFWNLLPHPCFMNWLQLPCGTVHYFPCRRSDRVLNCAVVQSHVPHCVNVNTLSIKDITTLSHVVVCERNKGALISTMSLGHKLQKVCHWVLHCFPGHASHKILWQVLFLQFTFEMWGPRLYRINPELYIFIEAIISANRITAN